MTPRPTPLQVRPEGIPASMQAEHRWVVWRYQWRNDKWTKVPYLATAPNREAKSTDAATWRSFAEAMFAYDNRVCDGIGFVLGDGWVGFDSDGYNALEHVLLLNTYTEQSPSGQGIHCICRGKKPGLKCKKKPYELYSHGRYFTVTGHHVDGTPTTVEERSAELAELYFRLFGPDIETVTTPAFSSHVNLSADEVIGRASRAEDGHQFQRLWSGYLGDHGDDHSRADFALCRMLAIHTNCNAEQIDILFRQSGLYRRKWDRLDYRTNTIAKSIASVRSSLSDGVMPGPEVNIKATELNEDWTGEF